MRVTGSNVHAGFTSSERNAIEEGHRETVARRAEEETAQACHDAALAARCPHFPRCAGIYVVQERLALTEDEQRLVPEAHPDARWLYATPGQEMPIAEAERFGLVDPSSKPQDA